MSDDLPEEFDLIVVGTGFAESCIAAAASRVGKTVLHIDANEYYGDAWSSFNLDALNNLLTQPNLMLRNGSYNWNETACLEEEQPVRWNREALLEKSRRFSLDLSPRVAYSAGDLVKLLIKSNICRYTEFRALDHVCIMSNNELVPVPCSRSDVFNTKMLTIVEKRMLMKFLTECDNYRENKCNEETLSFCGRTFLEFLQAQRVTDKIATCVMQAIAMCTADTSFEEGMQRTHRFLAGLGRYGNTPFLFPMYGCGELPQCFCRLSAVFGGVYCLKRGVDNITQSDTDLDELILSSAGKTLRAKHVVCAPSQIPAPLAHHYGDLRPHISRGLFIATSPLGNEELNKGGGGVNLLRLLSDDGTREAFFIQLSQYSGACPDGLYIYHLTTPAVSDDPSADLVAFTSQLFQSNATQILYSAYFTLTARTNPNPRIEIPIYCTAAPAYELDYDAAIANALDIFGKLYGDEEFLPRAPDPEEIVVEGEDPSALREHSLPEDLREQLQQMDIAE